MNRAFPLIPSRLHRALACASLSFGLAVPLAAQITAANDPANLAGERVSPPDLADTLPIDHGALALQQLLRKLRTRASFMLIVAHPDDEDGGMLTYLSRGQGARVAMLTLNRGEGGQNLMSADFDDALGLIRTQELLAADRYMAVDQLFGTEVDFGFSKTKEESFARWGHDRVLYDAVRAIRLYRPLVIASVFIGAPSDGHGQHQVSGEIAQEAFKAAGDPSVFPDMGLPPWQPLKVYARSPFARIDSQGMYDYATNQYVPARFTNYVTGKVTDTVPKANVIVPEGDTDPLLDGASYVQFARKGLALQRSQIGNNARLAPSGKMDVSYHRYGSKLNQPDGDDSGLESSFFEGIDTSINGIGSLAPKNLHLKEALGNISVLVNQAADQFDPSHPDKIAPGLCDALKTTDDLIQYVTMWTKKGPPPPPLPDVPLDSTTQFAPAESAQILAELRVKSDQLDNALILALGVTLDAEIAGPSRPLFTEEPFEVHVTLKTDGPEALQKPTFILLGAGLPYTKWPEPTPTASSWTNSLALQTGLQYPSLPYFTRHSVEQPYYDIQASSLRLAPESPPPLRALATFVYRGRQIGVTQPVDQLYRSPSGDIIRKPLSVVPPVNVSFSTPVSIVPPGQQSAKVTVEVQNVSDQPINGSVSVTTPGGWHREPKSIALTLAPNEGPKSIDFNIVQDQPHTQHGPQINNTFAIFSTGKNHVYTSKVRAVGYPGLKSTNISTRAAEHILASDLDDIHFPPPGLKIAYLPGTGDDVPAYLPDLGITPTILTLADLNPTTLSQYDAVILGVRAYAAHAELAGAGSRPLLQYASAGGVVIVQYNNSRYGDAEAPFPITVAASSGDHAHDVVDESQPVSILAPNDPLLTWPNRITTADFDHWVSERGHSFAGTWAPEYHPLLETHDPGQSPQRGGLIYAHTGKGLYIYLGYALYRQLPAGVPGPYRLLANLISAAKNPQLTPPAAK